MQPIRGIRMKAVLQLKLEYELKGLAWILFWVLLYVHFQPKLFNTTTRSRRYRFLKKLGENSDLIDESEQNEIFQKNVDGA